MIAAAELEALVYADPAEGSRRAADELRRARIAGDTEGVVVALAWLGRARRLLGQISLAETAFVEAIAVAESEARSDLAADGHLGLAGVRWFQGRTDEVEGHLDRAERDGSLRTRTHVVLQRAAIAQLLGRFDEAMERYGDALAMLEADGASLDLARVLSNRAVIYSNRAEPLAAIADLDRAAALFADAGQPFHAAQVVHNLGATYARVGDLPAALVHLDRAAEQLADLGHDAHEVESARVEALLAAGLFADAYDTAVEVRDRTAAAGNAVRSAEAELRCATAARLLGWGEEAEASALAACRFFDDQQSEGWSRAARLEALLARVARSGAAAVDPDEVDDLARRCASAGDRLGEVRALALFARVAAATGRVAAAAEAAASTGRLAGPLDTFEARLLAGSSAVAAAVAAGERQGGLRIARRVMRDVDAHRSTLGSADGRAHIGSHAAGVMHDAMALAVETGSSGEVLGWMDQLRAGTTEPEHRFGRDPEVAGALDELRQAGARLRAEALAGAASSETLASVRRLESRYRRKVLARRGSGAATGSRWVTPGAVRRAVAARTVVALEEVGGRVVAVVVGPRRARLVDVASSTDVAAAAAVVRRAAAGMHIGPVAARTARRRAFRAALDELDALVVVPLRLQAGDVVVVPYPSVADVPWGTLRSLADRAVSVAPSPGWLVESSPPATITPGPVGPAVIVAGPDLVEAATEADEIASMYDGARVLAGPAATGAAVVDALGGAPLAHLIAHGTFREDNPFWSSLELADGSLTAYELESLDPPPRVVVLSSCDVGRAAGPTALLGLASTLLTRGTRQVIAAVAPLPDTPATRAAMVRLHRHLVAGATPPQALAAARSCDEVEPLDVVVAFGHPT